jgi:GNAT superfamily N-acetyltransferase
VTELPAPTARLTVRRARRGDIPVLARLDLELLRHQAHSPTFSSALVPTLEESTEEWEVDFDDPAFATFVVEHDGGVVGSAVACPLEKSRGNAGMVRPDAAAFLGFAAVFPEARGIGAGRALGEAVLRWAAADGRFTSIATDWRETNLLSSRAWRALGYQDTFWRLHRLVGH